MSDITLHPLIAPPALDTPEAADFLAFAALNRRICEQDAGLPDLAPDAEQMLAGWHDSTDVLSTGFIARRAGSIVGMVSISYPQEESAESAEFDMLVPQDQWGAGVEAALLERVEREARSHSRSLLQTWSLHRPVNDPALRPRSGWGAVSATPLAVLLSSRGFLLEQVERNSELDLMGDLTPLQALLADAEAAAGPQYRTVSWSAPTPESLRDGYASILARLSTDAPSAAMEFTAEVWDADRVVRRESRLTGAGQLLSVAAVQHVPTGELVAYNELLIGLDRGGVTHQYGTLVAAAHRGHRLGTIVKCANLLRWRDLVPTSPRVSTFNAEENRPMLDINETVGFRPVSWAGAWQRRI